MKNTVLLLMIAASLGLVSCSSEESTETNEVEATTYTLDTEKSTLNWHGEENEEHFHDGTISFSEGSFTMKGDEVVSGDFTLDLASLKPMTEGYPAEKMEYLKGHLMDTSFFFAAEHPNITVKTAEYENGKLNTTINVRGIDVTTSVPVEIKSSENGVTIAGDFSIDFADAKIPYVTEPDPETGKPGAKTVFDFTMNLHLTK